MEDALFSTLGIILVVVGLLGSVLPVLPGAPVAFLGLLFFKLSNLATYAWWVVWVFLALALLGILLDYVVPAWGTKKMGGTKYGIWGTSIGLIVGIIFAPFGLISIILCPFLGAMIGELIYNKNDRKTAFKSALGSLIGFLLTTGYGLFISSVMCLLVLESFIAQYISPLFEWSDSLF